MANIPPEIWFNIAKFMPRGDLRNLLELNSVFFNIAMDIRYREIVICTRTTDRHIRILKRLNDPLVACRVYRLLLRLTHVRKAININASTSKHRLRHTITRLFGGSQSPRPRPINVASTDLLNEIMKIAHKFVNVRELYIDLLNPPPLYDLPPLYSSFWSAFEPKLYILTLRGTLEDFRTLIHSNPPLDALQELRVEFARSSLDGKDADRAILMNILLPFINNLAPHLLSLRLWSWAFLDLSSFFLQLAPFPGLKTLNVRTPFNQAFSDASGLKDLICNSSGTLRRVDLRLNPTGSVDPSIEEPLSRWLLECISDERFLSHLQVLDIYPTTMVAGMEFLLRCIQRTSKDLVELTLRDRYLQGREVNAVIDAASSCSNLTYLKMNIRTLDVAVIDLLALKLPQIDRLWLSVGDNVSNYSLVDEFIRDLSTRLYTNWKLDDIAIWQNGQEAENDIMLAMSRSIPSLTSFFSNGHMKLSRYQTIRQTSRFI